MTRVHANNKSSSGGGSGRKRETLGAECRSMCPDDEVSLRMKNNLVHVLEKRVVK